MPLVRAFDLSRVRGNVASIAPRVDKGAKRVTFDVVPTAPTHSGTVGRTGATCLVCGVAVPLAYVRGEGKAGRMKAVPMAVVADSSRGRVFLPAEAEQVATAALANPEWVPTAELPTANTRNFNTPGYGLDTYDKLFVARQLVALHTFGGLVAEAAERVRADASLSILGESECGTYAASVVTYLALAVSGLADRLSTLVTWDTGGPGWGTKIRNTFSRQALPMTWDFAEVNPFSGQSGSLDNSLDYTAKVVEAYPEFRSVTGHASQADARHIGGSGGQYMISTDPPYYDNIVYADLADFFYVWLRKSLEPIYPDLFKTMLTPKVAELVASQYRFAGSRQRAEQFFLEGLREAFAACASVQRPDLPLTVYYAYKQQQADDEGTASTGWETMLEGLIGSGFEITGTWPIRSELANRNVASGANALGSSIVLVCRPRPADAPNADRAEFLNALMVEMSRALPVLASGQVALPDFSQAAIGPGMSVYSRYGQVLRADGKAMSVREALRDINNAISTIRNEVLRHFDAETQFCVDWYEQFGFAVATFDDATKIARAKGVGVNTLEAQHLLEAERGRAYLVPLKSYPAGVAGLVERPFGSSTWEACLRLTQTLLEHGEGATAALARELGEGLSARARELAVWLYTIADNKKRTADSLAFNSLDASWSEMQRQMASIDRGQQGRLA